MQGVGYLWNLILGLSTPRLFNFLMFSLLATMMMSAWFSIRRVINEGTGGFEKLCIQMNFLPESRAKITAAIWLALGFFTQTASKCFDLLSFSRIFLKGVLAPSVSVFLGFKMEFSNFTFFTQSSLAFYSLEFIFCKRQKGVC